MRDVDDQARGLMDVQHGELGVCSIPDSEQRGFAWTYVRQNKVYR
jgi:hypothetical protein